MPILLLPYANHFPAFAAVGLSLSTALRLRMGAGAGVAVTEHQTGQNWHPDLTGADMLCSAHRLLESEAPIDGDRQVVASRHEATLGQNRRFEYSRFLVHA